MSATGGFPNRLFALLETEVFLLLGEDVIDGLVLMIQAVELRDAGLRLRVIDSEFFLAPAFLVAAFEEVVPFLQAVQRFFRGNCRHGKPPEPGCLSAGRRAAAMASYSSMKGGMQVTGLLRAGAAKAKKRRID
jgi:hypothetical protein